MPIVFMLEKPTRKRLRCISRVACEGYVLYAQKPAQGGGYDCALEGAGPLNAAGMAQAFMAAGIGEMLHNALHAEMEAGKRAARKARGKNTDEAPLSALQGLGVRMTEGEEGDGDAERADAGGAAGGEGAGGGADAARGQDAASDHA